MSARACRKKETCPVEAHISCSSACRALTLVTGSPLITIFFVSPRLIAAFSCVPVEPPRSLHLPQAFGEAACPAKRRQGSPFFRLAPHSACSLRSSRVIAMRPSLAVTRISYSSELPYSPKRAVRVGGNGVYLVRVTRQRHQ